MTYTPIDQIPPALIAGWRKPGVADRQRAVILAQLRTPPPHMRLLLSTLDTLPPGLLLDVGCGAGALPLFLQAHRPGHAWQIIGVDYAREMQPTITADVTALPFARHSADVVVSSGVLLHVPDWRHALREHVRVARGPIILARTPCVEHKPTQRTRQTAYGSAMLSTHFNRMEFMRACVEAGLTITAATPGQTFRAAGERIVMWQFIAH